MNVYFHFFFSLFLEKKGERERDGFWVVGLAGDCNGNFHQLYLMAFFYYYYFFKGIRLKDF